MIPIVIPLHPKGGKFGNDTEAKYAMRAMQKHVLGGFHLAIASRALPKWAKDVEWIDDGGQGLKTTLVMAARRFPDGFFWWYDDCILLKDQNPGQLQMTPANAGWGKVTTEWAEWLEKVRARLTAEGLQCFDYSRPHGPYWFTKAMIDEAFEDWPGMAGKFPFETWILNKHRWPCRHGVVKQYYGGFNGPPPETAVFLNFCDNGFTPELQAWLANQFPEPAKFEKASVVVPENIRLKAVCISVPSRPRWEDACVRDMAAVGIEVEVVEGFDGHAGHEPPMPLNHGAFRKSFRREMLPGEIGCWASHYQLARRYADLPPLCDAAPDWRLTFEDDAVPVGMDAVKMCRVALLAQERGYDVVLLNTGRRHKRGSGTLDLTSACGNDIFSHAVLWNGNAACEISRWEMRHPIDLALSKAKHIRVAVLHGPDRFDQRDPMLSQHSIHRERKGIPSISEAFEGISACDHRYGSNKLARHGYGPMYEEVLAPLAGTDAHLVEIGVCTGASLLGFRKFLGPTARITGLDIDLSHLKHTGERVLQANACDPAAGSIFEDESLSVVIDDGSHRLDDQWAAFEVFWQKLKPGGLHIIEDISDAFAFAVRFSGHRFRWRDTRDRAEKHDWSLCAVFQKPDAGGLPEAHVVSAYTLRWGNAEWIQPCAASLEAWCETHGFSLNVWGKPSEGKFPTAKFAVVEMLEDFLKDPVATHMVYLDADVFVHPDAPAFPICPGLMTMTDRPHQRWNADWEDWCMEQFGERPHGYHYRNAGLWACDKEAARRLLEVATPPFIERVQDQHQFNWWVYRAIKGGMRLQDLHPTWNRDSSANKPAWMFHLWGDDKMAKLEKIRRSGLVHPRKATGNLLVADCAWQKRRGLGNRVTLLCDAYATAKTRGMELAFTWETKKHCGARWGDLFKPLQGIELLESIPAGAEVRRHDAYYTGSAEHHTDDYWAAWREMARMIELTEDLELPMTDPFDAISLRLTHPKGSYHNRWAAKLPRLSRAFVSSDCQQGIEWLREALPDAWTLSPKLFNEDDVHRDIEHMRGAARDMMMLTRARTILTIGRESTFRNLAHIGYQVPVLRFYEGLAP